MSRRKQARPIRHLETEDGLVSALPNGKLCSSHCMGLEGVCHAVGVDLTGRQTPDSNFSPPGP